MWRPCLGQWLHMRSPWLGRETKPIVRVQATWRQSWKPKIIAPIVMAVKAYTKPTTSNTSYVACA